MPKEDPIRHLDELIEQATSRISELDRENQELKSQLRELEERVKAEEIKASQAAELGASVARLEGEREEIRSRVEQAADRLRRVLGNVDAAAEVEVVGDEEPALEDDEDES